MQNAITRFSESELGEFKELIQKKLQKAQGQLEDLHNQLIELMDSNEEGFGTDYIDDSSTGSQVELLNEMAIRQRKHIKDLENALIRIRNKTYGICVVTGEMIDKKRLMAVPTTTKSIQAKTQSLPVKSAASQDENDEEEDEKPAPRKAPAAPKIITKVIRKAKPAVARTEDDDEDLLAPATGWQEDDDDDDDPVTYVDDMDNFLDEEDDNENF